MISSKTSHQGILWRNFYGRRKGKPLRATQKRLLDEKLAHLCLKGVSLEDNPSRAVFDVKTIAAGRQIWLEIGFGGGEHLVHQAQQNSAHFFIGSEPYINGVAMLLHKIDERNADNIAIYPGDVRDILEILPQEVLGRVFLLYPDPWPKKRHHRRRFVTAEHLAYLTPAMKKGAELRIASDIDDYIRQALEEVPKAGFEWQAECAKDWQNPWLDWCTTRYEKKALREGRRPTYLTFLRK